MPGLVLRLCCACVADDAAAQGSGTESEIGIASFRYAAMGARPREVRGGSDEMGVDEERSG